MEFLTNLLSYPWWYYLIAIIVGAIGFVGYVMYSGYNRVRPKPLKGIPCPPMTHTLLGHPEAMLHPVKHEIRSQFSENFPYALYQLCLMNHTGIFINDPTIAAEVIETIPTKGVIYGTYRYDQALPDTLACDGDSYELRKQYLLPAYQSIAIPSLNDPTVTADLLKCIEAYSLHQDPLDVKKLFTLFALDIICKYYFHYDLQGVNGSNEGGQVYHCLTILYDAATSNGIYALPNAKKTTPEELNQAKTIWKEFLASIYGHIQKVVKEYEDSMGTLDHEHEMNHAFVYFQRQQGISEDEIKNEIHQILRHGHETIAASLSWITYVLHKNKRVRDNVEKAILQHSTSYDSLSNDNYPEYLESVLKELFRRYPAAGNMTVRTVNQEVMHFGGFQIPRGSPLHVHMYSLQNTARNWNKPKEFIPERWFDASDSIDESAEAADSYSGFKGSYPQCPFLSSLSSANVGSSSSFVYEGAGFQDHGLSYLPFSVGQRACLGRLFSLQILRKVLYDIAKNYRLNPVEVTWEEDVGISLHTVIVPFSTKSTSIRVQKIDDLQQTVESTESAAVIEPQVGEEAADGGSQNKKATVVVEEEGWADENDFDFVENKDQ